MGSTKKDCWLTGVDIISILIVLIFGVFICLSAFHKPENDAFVHEVFVALFGLVTLVVTDFIKKFISKGKE